MTTSSAAAELPLGPNARQERALALWRAIPDRLNVPFRFHEMTDLGEDIWWACEVERRRLRLERFANMNPADRVAVVAAERQLCAIDVVHWISNYVWIEDPRQANPARRELPFVPWEAQVELIHRVEDAIRRGVDLTIVKGRALGASWTVQVDLLHHFIFEPSRFLAMSCSRKESYVDDRTVDSLFGKYRYVIDRLPGFLRPPIARDKHMLILNARTRSQLTGESTNDELGRGGRQRVLFLDEFAHVQPQLQESVYNSTVSVASCRIFGSTPAGPGNRFAKLERADVNVYRMTWRADPRRATSWRSRVIASGLEVDTFNQEHEGRVITMGPGRVWQARRTRDEYADSDPRFNTGWRDYLGIIGGWDFGSGASRLVCLMALAEPLNDGRFRLWVDTELHWEQTAWRTAAADVLTTTAVRYGDTAPSIHYGDPAGTAAESDQQSWEQNLRDGGIPLVCLPDDARSRDANEWGIKAVQAMLDDELLLVHRRCSYLWECLENWRRRLAQGQDPDHVATAYVPPRHDVYSHGAYALTYLVRGAFAAYEDAKASTVHMANPTGPGRLRPSGAGRASAMLRHIRNAPGSPLHRLRRLGSEVDD